MKKNTPVTLIIFGGTGDLFKRKIAPSLFTLFEEGKLPGQFKVLGSGRSPLTDETYQSLVKTAIVHILGVTPPQAFVELFSYVQGEVHDSTLYSALEQRIFASEVAWKVSESRIIWYFSIAPELYGTITQRIQAATELRTRSKEHVQVLIEKPLGYDTSSFSILNREMLEAFDESQLYRIEHYLTKETIQYIPQFRAKHRDVDVLLDAQSVSRIRINFHETIGVEKRGAFYDSVGALRDVGQNHVLEMLATVCMDVPSELTSDTVQAARVTYLQSLPIAEKADVEKNARRLQHEGYRDIEGVSEGSNTETAYEIKTTLTDLRWKGVGVVMSAGKRIMHKSKVIICEMKAGVMHDGRPLRAIVFSIDPESVIFVYASHHADEHVVHNIRPGHVQKYQYVEEYSRVLSAAFEQDKKYSVSAEEVAAFWRFVDAYTTVWDTGVVSVESYERDTMPFIY